MSHENVQPSAMHGPAERIENASGTDSADQGSHQTHARRCCCLFTNGWQVTHMVICLPCVASPPLRSNPSVRPLSASETKSDAKTTAKLSAKMRAHVGWRETTARREKRSRVARDNESTRGSCETTTRHATFEAAAITTTTTLYHIVQSQTQV